MFHHLLSSPVKRALLFLVLSLLLYGNTLWNQYSMDDNLVYLNNPIIERGLAGILDVFTTHYVQIEHKSFDYRPIVKLLAGVEVLLFGYNPSVGHLINVLLYAVCLILLFAFLKRVFSENMLSLVFMSILIFAFHPVHTEVVASLKNRDELFSFIFSMNSGLYFFRWFEERRWHHFLTGVLFFALAMISKSSAMVFAALIPFALWFRHRIKISQVVLVFIPLALCVLVFFGLLLLILPATDRDPYFFENPLFFDKTITMRLGTAVITVLHYVRLLLIPDKLLFYYGYDAFPVISVFSFIGIVGFVALIAIAIYGLRLVLRQHPSGFGILYFFIAISMFSNLFVPAVGIVADRFAFHASVGFSILVSSLFVKFYHSKKSANRSAAVGSLIVLLLLYTIKTIDRNRDWKDTLTLYAADVPYLERSMKANLLFGNTLFQEIVQTAHRPELKKRNQQYLQQSIIHLQKAAQIYPQYPRIWNSLGAVHYMLLRDFEKAKHYFFTALQYDSTYLEPLYNLGFVYENTQKPDSALYYYHKCLQYDSGYVNAYTRLIFLYHLLGDTVQSYRINQLMLQRFPNLDVPYVLMGNHYLLQTDTVQAVFYWEKAIEKGSQNLELIKVLQNYYLQRKDQQKRNFYQQLELQILQKQKAKKKMPKFL